jgi:hypothetical protein
MTFGKALRPFIPVRLAARIWFHLRPMGSTPWGGPLNGQCGRQQIAVDLFRTFPFTHVVETGTFYGNTTEFLARETQLPVFTVEADRSAYEVARLRLRNYPKVQLFFGDSRSFLSGLISQTVSAASLPFFYLDAHWGADLPLLEEIEVILRIYPRFVAMVDDFQVPDDPGYGFDDYGGTKVLAGKLLEPVIKSLAFGYPRLPSARESGSRRGCIVLSSRELCSQLRTVPSLRVD